MANQAILNHYVATLEVLFSQFPFFMCFFSISFTFRKVIYEKYDALLLYGINGTRTILKWLHDCIKRMYAVLDNCTWQIVFNFIHS